MTCRPVEATIADNNPLAGLDDLAAQVKSAGIDRVDGDVVIDDRLWITRDLGENDGLVSPIVTSNNLIDVVARPGEVGGRASVEMRPEVAPWRVVNRVKTVAAGEDAAIDLRSPEYGVILLRPRRTNGHLDARRVSRRWRDTPACPCTIAALDAEKPSQATSTTSGKVSIR